MQKFDQRDLDQFAAGEDPDKKQRDADNIRQLESLLREQGHEKPDESIDDLRQELLKARERSAKVPA